MVGGSEAPKRRVKSCRLLGRAVWPLDVSYSPMRWEVIMRGTWEVVGRMALKVCGRGADGRMALGMFWKSGAGEGGEREGWMRQADPAKGIRS